MLCEHNLINAFEQEQVGLKVALRELSVGARQR